MCGHYAQVCVNSCISKTAYMNDEDIYTTLNSLKSHTVCFKFLLISLVCNCFFSVNVVYELQAWLCC